MKEKKLNQMLFFWSHCDRATWFTVSKTGVLLLNRHWSITQLISIERYTRGILLNS